MSVITFPVVARKPRAVTASPATVIHHPRSIGELAAEAVERIESERLADADMAAAHRDMEIAILKLTAVAIMHERQSQAKTMLQIAMERMRAAFA